MALDSLSYGGVDQIEAATRKIGRRAEGQKVLDQALHGSFQVAVVPVVKQNVVSDRLGVKPDSGP